MKNTCGLFCRTLGKLLVSLGKFVVVGFMVTLIFVLNILRSIISAVGIGIGRAEALLDFYFEYGFDGLLKKFIDDFVGTVFGEEEN